MKNRKYSLIPFPLHFFRVDSRRCEILFVGISAVYYFRLLFIDTLVYLNYSYICFNIVGNVLLLLAGLLLVC